MRLYHHLSTFFLWIPAFCLILLHTSGYGQGSPSTTHVWIGSGGGNWTTWSNWETGSFTDTSGSGPFRILVFRNENSQTVDNDMVIDSGGFNTDSLIFEEGAGAYTLTGQSLDMLGNLPDRNVGTADIINYSSNIQTINLNLIARPDFTTALVFNTAGGDIIVNGVISTSGSGATPVIRKLGDHTLELTNTNTYTGRTEILGGTLKVSSLANHNVNSPIGKAPTADPEHLLLDNGTLYYAGASNVSINRGFTLGANGGTLKTDAGIQLAFSGVVTGEGDLTIAEGSTIALTSTTSDFTGSIIIKENATLRINNLDNLTAETSPLGAATSDPSKLQLDGGTLEYYSNAPRSTVHGITLLDLGGTVHISNATGGIRWTGQVTGVGSLDVKGPGYLALTNNNNDYSGVTTVHSGAILEIRQGNALGEYDADSYTLVKSGGTLTFNPGGAGGPGGSAGIATSEFINVESGGKIQNTGRSNTINNTITLQGSDDVNFAIASGSLRIAGGKLSGSGNLLKTGNGTLVLGTNNNSYSGQITVREGTLQVGTFGNNFGNGVRTLTLDGGAFRYTGAAASLNDNILLTENGGTFDVTNAWRAAGIITGNGPLTITGTTYVAISNENNDYTGVTMIEAGAAIYLRNSNVLGATGAASATEVYGTLALDPNNTGGPASGGLSVNETFVFHDGSSLENRNRDSTLNGPVELADGTTRVVVASGSSLTIASAITGDGALLFDNATTATGRVILTNANTYSGPTTLNNGVFQVGRSGTGSIASATTVNAPATLSGSGSILQHTDLHGILSPGDNGGEDIGTLSINSLALKDGATLLFKFNAADAYFTDISELATLSDPAQSGANDFVMVSGVLSADPDAVINLQLDFTGMTITHGMVFDLFDATSFDFAGSQNYNISFTGADPDFTIDTSRFADSGFIAVTLVPEPGRVLLLLTALGLVTLRRRRTSTFHQ